jgi:FlaA1/EpsC-like NDP-sugar epimerase
MMYDELLAAILKRRESLFGDDLAAHQVELEARIRHSRILVIGAAGSIGAAFVHSVVRYRPQALHLIDPSENNLVEVVRDIRSSGVRPPADFRTLAIGLGTEEWWAFLRSGFTYDYVVNFSALKHVRSERDPFTLMRMYKTNVLYLHELLKFLHGRGIERFFSVSSDKAVHPANLMGATKQFMERIMLLHSDAVSSSTARFANVAFSDGSLLFGFEKRLLKRQPITAPTDVRRYFISHQEAGQLCLLGCFLGGNRDVYIPILNASEDLLSFSDIARLFLEDRGYEPLICESEEQARRVATDCREGDRKWPCFFAPSDTSGEKPFEEFTAPDELVDNGLYKRTGVIHQSGLGPAAAENLQIAMQKLAAIRNSEIWEKAPMVAAIGTAIPELCHHEEERNLDEKM